jgi:imidazolonepropionase-like amidohydrolase
MGRLLGRGSAVRAESWTGWLVGATRSPPRCPLFHRRASAATKPTRPVSWNTTDDLLDIRGRPLHELITLTSNADLTGNLPAPRVLRNDTLRSTALLHQSQICSRSGNVAAIARCPGVSSRSPGERRVPYAGHGACPSALTPERCVANTSGALNDPAGRRQLMGESPPKRPASPWTPPRDPGRVVRNLGEALVSAQKRAVSAAAWGLVTLIVMGASQTASAQTLLITNARVLNVRARTETTQNVLIRDGVIAGFLSSRPQDFSGRVIDAGGRWLMPALSDMHTHSVGNFMPPGGIQMVGPEGVARAALYAGVARYLDLFSPEDAIFAARASRAAATTPGAEIFAAGPCLTATKGHCSEYGVPTRIVDSPADATREVNALAPKKPDVVKVVYDHRAYAGRSMPTIDRATLEAVVAAAQANGLKTVVHVGTWEDVRHAVLAGAAVVTHTPEGPPPTDIPALMRERGTLHIPTLAVQGDYSRLVDDPSLLDSPLLLSMIGAKAVALFKGPPAGPMEAWLKLQRTLRETDGAAVRTLAAAGVLMVTGTDGGNPGVFQGYSVHRELRLLREAGLSPWDVLATTTINAGRLLGRKWGTDIGDEGTLILLDASPLADIRNTERIHAVILRGAMVDRDALRPASP